MTLSQPSSAATRKDAAKAIRVDLQIIAEWIEPRSRVLDVGCGDGVLLDYLTEFKGVDGRGIELSMDGVRNCVSAGLSVIQGDAERDLKDFPDGAFDYVVLSQTLQAMQQPRVVLEQMLRIGRRAVISFPNFGHWKVRAYLGLRGRMPVSETLPLQWYETPNIHFCTILDFVELCREMGITIERARSLTSEGESRAVIERLKLANLFGQQGLFLLRG